MKIKRGIGAPGKLWTGDSPENGEVANARIMERTCSCCGNSTRKFRVEKVENAEALATACEIATLFLTMGGVGSVATGFATSDGQGSVNPREFQLWNWSGRVGGHAILNPVAVLDGYWEPETLPTPRAGFYWTRTYCGSTLSEFVLLRVGEDEGDEGSAHALPVIKLEGKCPPCRHKEAVENLPEDLMVTREALTATGLSEEQMGEIFSSVVHMDGGSEVRASPTIQARLLLAYTGWKHPEGVEQILVAIEVAKKGYTPPAMREEIAASVES